PGESRYDRAASPRRMAGSGNSTTCVEERVVLDNDGCLRLQELRELCCRQQQLGRNAEPDDLGDLGIVLGNNHPWRHQRTRQRRFVPGSDARLERQRLERQQNSDAGTVQLRDQRLDHKIGFWNPLVTNLTKAKVHWSM